MGTEICKNCNTNNNILTEKNLSNNSFIEEENNFKQINYFINKNKTSRFESNISTKFINNENENNISNYDNPLYNTSLEESMNLGNCYIGTNKNNTKIKPYNPENSLHTIINKKRLSIEPNPNPKEFPFEKKMNQTLKNFNKKNIRYNLLFNTGNNEKEEKKQKLKNKEEQIIAKENQLNKKLEKIELETKETKENLELQNQQLILREKKFKK